MHIFTAARRVGLGPNAAPQYTSIWPSRCTAACYTLCQCWKSTEKTGVAKLESLHAGSAFGSSDGSDVDVLQVYRNLQYFVPMPGKHKKDNSGKQPRLELLKSISGATVPGQLTALMGGSGAGKVFLLLSAPA